MDGVEVSVMGCFINSCQCQPIHPFLMVEEQSSVYQSRCIVASSARGLTFEQHGTTNHFPSVCVCVCVCVCVEKEGVS